VGDAHRGERGGGAGVGLVKQVYIGWACGAGLDGALMVWLGLGAPGCYGFDKGKEGSEMSAGGRQGV
jgi:hypothetical protein